MLRAAGRATAALGVAFGGGAGLWYAYTHRPPPVDSALQHNKSLTCKLLQVSPLTHDTALFRFELPTSEHVLGLPTASHSGSGQRDGLQRVHPSHPRLLRQGLL